jgi:hypothetical protein
MVKINLIKSGKKQQSWKKKIKIKIKMPTLDTT